MPGVIFCTETITISSRINNGLGYFIVTAKSVTRDFGKYRKLNEISDARYYIHLLNIYIMT